jgi:menaquinone-9 beta-reductase
MINADVVVVGAGPGGAATAYFLAKRGVDVLLVEKETMPRDKACGDGFAYESIQVMRRMGLADWVASNAAHHGNRVLLSSPGDKVATIALPHDPSFEMFILERSKADKVLVDAAVQAGARLLENTLVDGLERMGAGRLRLLGKKNKTEAIAIDTRLAISAEGAHGLFAKKAGITVSETNAVALRCYYAGDAGDAGLQEIHWDKRLAPGYGWLFPMRDGVANVGVGVVQHGAKKQRLNLKRMLEEFVATNPSMRHRLGNARRISPIKGFPLKTNAHRVIPYADSILLVGEVAGLVNPLTGEGIGPAMISGEIAAEVAADALAANDFSAGYLRRYGSMLRRALLYRHLLSLGLQRLFAYPWLLDRTISKAGNDKAFGEKLVKVITGIDTMESMARPRWLMKFLWG